MSILHRNRLMAITIPGAEFENLALIVGFEKSLFDALVKALDETSPTLLRPKYLAALASHLPSDAKKDVSQVLNTLFALYSIKANNNFSAEDLAKHIRQSVESSKEHAPKFSNGKGDVLEKRLTVLLSHDNSLAVTAKAMQVMREHQRVFCHTRILTDMRPVFADKPDSPAGAMIVHNLQIGFKNSEGENHEEFYVALDDGDLDRLSYTIERARQKSRALKATIKKAQLACLE